MLIKSSSAHNVAIGYDPRYRFGPRATPRPLTSLATTAATYNGVFMRPNLSSTGTVPAQGTLSSCPDIWIGGVNPVANYQTALATTSSYATQSGSTITPGTPNYIYVRGKNGATTTQSTGVQLYALPCAVIQWPSQWGQYAIPTDIAHDPSQPPVYLTNINNLATGAIGVAADTFVWSQPTPPPAGSDHYCLISWYNNPSNPFPNVFNQVDMSSLVTNDLGFGWRNVGMGSGTQPTGQMQTQLEIPQDMTPGSTQYSIQISTTGFPAGWKVSMSCSRTDDKGNTIGFPQQVVPISPKFIGVYAYLSPGFSSTLTLNFYSDGSPSTNGQVDVQVNYIASAALDLEMALAANVIDFELSAALSSAFRGFGIGPTPTMRLGSDSKQFR